VASGLEQLKEENIKISLARDWRSTPTYCQKSRDTKTRTKI